MNKEDFSSLSAFLEEILFHSTLCLEGSTKLSHSRSFGRGLPVRAWSKCVVITVSRRISRWRQLEITFLRYMYIYLLNKPCISAEKAACGCDFAILLRRVMLDDHDWTLAHTSLNKILGAYGCSKVSLATGSIIDPLNQQRSLRLLQCICCCSPTRF